MENGKYRISNSYLAREDGDGWMICPITKVRMYKIGKLTVEYDPTFNSSLIASDGMFYYIDGIPLYFLGITKLEFRKKFNHLRMLKKSKIGELL